MEWDDVVYLALLIFSIAFGKFLRQIEDLKTRRHVATLVGVSIVLLVSGKHIFHPLFVVLVNSLFIFFLDKKVVHIASFTFSFLYLLFFRMTEYFGIPYPPPHTNLVQMILTLKIVGLAFEVHDTHVQKSNPPPDYEFTKVEPPSLVDILEYSFCYVGVLTGPYYSYRTYHDAFSKTFSKYAPCEAWTFERLKLLPMFAVFFLVASYFYPLQYVKGDEFNNERSLLYRLWYILPSFFIFRMRMYIGMRMSEGVCIMAGVGAYPTFSKPKPGKGPSMEYEKLVDMYKDDQKAKSVEYDFTTVHNIEPYGAEFDYTVRSSMKSWNMSVQYWLATFVYRRFPIKPYRTLVTFVLSSFWHGVYAGYYLCIGSAPLYLPVEDIYYKNLKDVKVSPMVSIAWFWVCYWWRMLLMGYWGIAFSLLHVNAALALWRSVYFIPSIISILMLVVSRFIFPTKAYLEAKKAKEAASKTE